MRTVRILVEVHVNDEGSVRSTHRAFSDEDTAKMRELPSGGVVQVAHAMFLEALRRESYTMAISQLSSGKTLEEMTEKDLDTLTRAHILEMCEKFSPKASEETLKMLRS